MKLNDFLNPRSMLTPGVAGMVIMGISNTLWVSFSIPKTWSSLLLSFLLAILVSRKFTAALYEKAIFIIFNTLIIFSLAVNTNFAGRKISEFSSYETMASVTQYSANYNPTETSGSIPSTTNYQQGIPTKRRFFQPYF